MKSLFALAGHQLTCLLLKTSTKISLFKSKKASSFAYLPFLLMSTVLLFGSCGDDEEMNPVLNADCWTRTEGEIVFTQLRAAAITPPSKVSVFFKLDDSDGQPIANLTEADFNIYEQTDNGACLQSISVFEAERAVTQQPKDFSHTTLIVLDLSGSVLTNFSEALKDATKSLVREINSDSISNFSNIGIYWFDGSATLHQLIAPSFDEAAVLAAIDNINTSLSTDNSTNLYGAVTTITKQANDILRSDENTLGVSILLFTDGKDRANRVAKETAYEAVDSSNAAISYFAVGLGEETSEEDLRKFGRDQFVNIQEISELTSTFTSIAQSVEDESNSYYLFEYCSPVRGGTDNILIIEAIQENDKGFLENTFNAEGFQGGCSL